MPFAERLAIFALPPLPPAGISQAFPRDVAMELRDELQATLGDAYTLERELGGGGMSRVFVAEERALARRVVVKVLPPTLAAEVSIERFKREIQVAAGLQHAHIVPVLNAGETRGMPYYTMPFVDGESLRARLSRGGPLPIGDTISVLRDVSRALAYAHEHGVVHRDIKPDNVMLSGGSAVVTDFGIAKAITAARAPGVNTTLTQVGTSLGTPAYMAPEQAAGDPSTDHRADLYALGCMAYEMLTGQPPFVEKSAQQLLAAHMARTPEPVAARRVDTPAALAALVTRCLEKNATDRPASAADFARDLETVTSGGGHGAMPSILLAGAGATRRALAIYAAAFAVVLLLTKAAIVVIGLPDWVLPGAFIVMALGLPAILATGYVHRVTQRAFTATPTYTPGGTPSAAAHGTMATIAMKASPHVSWRRTGLGGAIALGTFAFLVVVWMTLRAFGIGPGGSLFAKGTLATGDQILVADFKATGPDSALGPVLAEAMRTSLSQSRDVRVVAASAVGAALERMQRSPTTPVDFALARDIATRDGFKAVLSGEVAAVSSGGYLVSAKLIATANGDVLVSAQEPARDAEQLIPAMDRIGRKLRGDMGESLKRVQGAPALAKVTTASLEALRKYTEGARANDVERNYNKSAALLDSAIALDSSFGMAYNKLAITLGNRDGATSARAVSVYERGLAHRDEFAESERLVFMAQYWMRGPHSDRGKAVEAFEEAGRKYPELMPVIANNLALTLISRREFARSESLYTWVIKERPDYVIPRSNIVTPQVALGHFDAARRQVAEARTMPGIAAGADRAEGRILLNMGHADSAVAFFTRALTSKDPFVAAGANLDLGRMAARGGRLRESTRWLETARTMNRARGVAVGAFDSSIDSLDRSIWVFDRKDEALRQLDAIIGRARPEQRTLAMANFYAQLGRPDRAKEILAQVQAAAVDTVARRRQEPVWHQTSGWIAFAEGRYQEAIAEFRTSDRLPDGPRLACAICIDIQVGMSFERAGMADSAIASYEHYVTTPTYERQAYDLPLGWVLRHLGELYQTKDPAKAAAYYTRFVELWKDADAEVQPQVTDVRERLQRLAAAAARKG